MSTTIRISSFPREEEDVNQRYVTYKDVPKEGVLNQNELTILSPSESQIISILSDETFPLGLKHERKRWAISEERTPTDYRRAPGSALDRNRRRLGSLEPGLHEDYSPDLLGSSERKKSLSASSRRLSNRSVIEEPSETVPEEEVPPRGKEKFKSKKKKKHEVTEEVAPAVTEPVPETFEAQLEVQVEVKKPTFLRSHKDDSKKSKHRKTEDIDLFEGLEELKRSESRKKPKSTASSARSSLGRPFKVHGKPSKVEEEISGKWISKTDQTGEFRKLRFKHGQRSEKSHSTDLDVPEVQISSTEMYTSVSEAIDSRSAVRKNQQTYLDILIQGTTSSWGKMRWDDDVTEETLMHDRMDLIANTTPRIRPDTPLESQSPMHFTEHVTPSDSLDDLTQREDVVQERLKQAVKQLSEDKVQDHDEKMEKAKVAKRVSSISIKTASSTKVIPHVHTAQFRRSSPRLDKDQVTERRKSLIKKESEHDERIKQEEIKHMDRDLRREELKGNLLKAFMLTRDTMVGRRKRASIINEMDLHMVRKGSIYSEPHSDSIVERPSVSTAGRPSGSPTEGERSSIPEHQLHGMDSSKRLAAAKRKIAKAALKQDKRAEKHKRKEAKKMLQRSRTSSGGVDKSSLQSSVSSASAKTRRTDSKGSIREAEQTTGDDAEHVTRTQSVESEPFLKPERDEEGSKKSGTVTMSISEAEDGVVDDEKDDVPSDDEDVQEDDMEMEPEMVEMLEKLRQHQSAYRIIPEFTKSLSMDIRPKAISASLQDLRRQTDHVQLQDSQDSQRYSESYSMDGSQDVLQRSESFHMDDSMEAQRTSHSFQVDGSKEAQRTSQSFQVDGSKEAQRTAQSFQVDGSKEAQRTVQSFQVDGSKEAQRTAQSFQVDGSKEAQRTAQSFQVDGSKEAQRTAQSFQVDGSKEAQRTAQSFQVDGSKEAQRTAQSFQVDGSKEAQRTAQSFQVDGSKEAQRTAQSFQFDGSKEAQRTAQSFQVDGSKEAQRAAQSFQVDGSKEAQRTAQSFQVDGSKEAGMTAQSFQVDGSKDVRRSESLQMEGSRDALQRSETFQPDGARVTQQRSDGFQLDGATREREVKSQEMKDDGAVRHVEMYQKTDMKARSMKDDDSFTASLPQINAKGRSSDTSLRMESKHRRYMTDEEIASKQRRSTAATTGRVVLEQHRPLPKRHDGPDQVRAHGQHRKSVQFDAHMVIGVQDSSQGLELTENMIAASLFGHYGPYSEYELKQLKIHLAKEATEIPRMVSTEYRPPVMQPYSKLDLSYFQAPTDVICEEIAESRNKTFLEDMQYTKCVPNTTAQVKEETLLIDKAKYHVRQFDNMDFADTAYDTTFGKDWARCLKLDVARMNVIHRLLRDPRVISRRRHPAPPPLKQREYSLKEFRGWDMDTPLTQHIMNREPNAAENARTMLRMIEEKMAVDKEALTTEKYPKFNPQPDQEAINYSARHGLDELFRFMLYSLIEARPDNAMDYLIEMTREIKRQMRIRYEAAKVMMLAKTGLKEEPDESSGDDSSSTDYWGRSSSSRSHSSSSSSMRSFSSSSSSSSSSLSISPASNDSTGPTTSYTDHS